MNGAAVGRAISTRLGEQTIAHIQGSRDNVGTIVGRGDRSRRDVNLGPRVTIARPDTSSDNAGAFGEVRSSEVVPSVPPARQSQGESRWGSPARLLIPLPMLASKRGRVGSAEP